jgi:DNA-binding CsgD family transcriptional regulator
VKPRESEALYLVRKHARAAATQLRRRDAAILEASRAGVSLREIARAASISHEQVRKTVLRETIARVEVRD